MTYYASAFRTPIVRPADSTLAIGVLVDPTVPKSIVGIAFPVSHVGGMRWDAPLGDYPPPEVVWRLEIDRAWIEGKIVNLEAREVLDGRFVLRSGVFVELSEEAT